MGKPLRALIVEDSQDDLLLLTRELGRLGYELEFERVDTAEAMRSALRKKTWDIIFSDERMPAFSSMQALEVLKASGLDLPFILISGTIGEEAAISALKSGANDFLVKGKFARLGPAIERELREVVIRRERKRAEEKIQRQLQRLSALRSIDTAISSSFDMHMSLSILLTGTVRQLEVDAASVLLFNKSMLTLEYAAGNGFNSPAIRQTRLRVGEGITGRAAQEQRTVHIANLQATRDGFLRQELLKDEGFVSYYAAPLIAKGELKGMLEVFQRAELHPDQEWLDFLGTLAGQAAIAIDNAQLFESLERSNIELELAYDATIEGWSRAMDLRDKETEGHTQRVTDLTLKLADSLKVEKAAQVHIRRGALLHDMGKLGVPDAILHKAGKLTDEEWEIMRQHPRFAYDMLHQIHYLAPALEIPYCHHEKWDGTGYPRGLSGEAIPLAARIFATVDVWDALTSDRPYRKAWSREQALAYIQEQSGKHFDPRIVRAFLRMMTEA